MLCAPHGPWIAAFDPLRARCDDLLGFRTQWSDQGSVVTPSNVRSMAFRFAISTLYSKDVGPPIGDAVRSQTSNGVWDAVGRSHEHPPPDQRKRAEGTTSSWRSALFCCPFRGHWLHLCASFPNEACFGWKLILFRSLKFTPLSVGFFIVWSVWRLRRCLSLEGSSTYLGSKMWSVTTKGLLRQTLWLFLRH